MKIKGGLRKWYFAYDNNKRASKDYDDAVQIFYSQADKIVRYIVRIGKNHGLVTINHWANTITETVPCEYKSVEYKYPYSNTQIDVVTHENLHGVYDKDGKIIIPAEFDSIEKDVNTYIVSKDKKFGAWNTEGEEILPTEFDLVSSRRRGFTVKKDGKFGFYDIDGKEIIPIEHDYIDVFDTAISTKNGKFYSLYDLKGKVIVPGEITGFNGKPFGIEVYRFDKTGLYSNDGKLLVPVEYDNLTYKGDYIIAKKDGKQGLYSYTGEIIVPVEFDELSLIESIVSIPSFIVRKGNKRYCLRVENLIPENFLTKLTKKLAENGKADEVVGKHEENIALEIDIKDVTEENKDDLY